MKEKKIWPNFKISQKYMVEDIFSAKDPEIVRYIDGNKKYLGIFKNQSEIYGEKKI